jgi:hypothetical protein
VRLAEVALIVAPGAESVLVMKLSPAHRRLVTVLRRVPVAIAYEAHARGGRQGGGGAETVVLGPPRQR